MTAARTFVGRKSELLQLEEFVTAPGPGFLHLRGRRRIGKSWLLTKWLSRRKGLYFQGEQDSSTKQLQQTLARLWDDHIGRLDLSLIRQRDLSWEIIFKHITRTAQQHRDQTVLLVFDEIHWIAKRNSGFVSKVKRAWLSWEKAGNIKLVICGSSSRFFDDKVSKASSILRGLRTQADLWVKPFSLREVKQHFFPKWTPEEVCLLYMMIGGVPYYLNQVPRTANFINAVNRAFFTRTTIFLDELDELITLEFNQTTKSRIRQILAALGQAGRTVARIHQSTQIPESSVREAITKLVDYGLVFEKTPRGAGARKNKSRTQYYMRDFYLNFYFSVLAKHEAKITENVKANLFSRVLASKSGYYIPQFTGLAFELLIESIISGRASSTLQETIFSKLGIQETGYEWGHFWQWGETQVDLIVESSADRESRVLEVKWLSTDADVTRGYIEQIQEKVYYPPRGYRISYYLVLSKPPTSGLRKAADENDVTLIGLGDLF